MSYKQNKQKINYLIAKCNTNTNDTVLFLENIQLNYIFVITFNLGLNSLKYKSTNTLSSYVSSLFKQLC